MRINLYDIAKRKELDRQLSLGLDELQQLIGDYEGYTPSSSYDVEIEARKIAEGFRVKVLVKGSALGQCTRCPGRSQRRSRCRAHLHPAAQPRRTR